MDFEPYFKVHNLVSVHPKSIILMFFHVVMSVYRLVKIWNSPQFPDEFRNGQLCQRVQGSQHLAAMIRLASLGHIAQGHIAQVYFIVYFIYVKYIIMIRYEWFWKFWKLHKPLGECNLRIFKITSAYYSQIVRERRVIFYL